ncbi:MAG: response regulator transcription factor [Flavobacteriales bacterium]|nr:response regulator transcription factor [Flavobacteriales bacterium]
MIKLLIVDDHPYMRQCLIEMVDKSEKINLVGECTDGIEVLPFLEKNEIDVIIMDYRMPIQNGLETTKLVRHLYPNIKTIILSTEENYVTKKEFINNGACDVISKFDIHPSKLISTILNVCRVV